jgi:serine/threonine-protein kinase
MNDRLHHNPVPPREIEPAVTPQLQEIVYRAMAREPRNRYASAREFMGDLEYPGGVEAAERAELRDWTWRRTPLSRRILTYTVFALIPIVIFTLLLYVARHA